MVKEKDSCSPENLQGVASELRKLAAQVEAGQVTVGGVSLAICNAVALKVKQKLVGGKVKYELSLTASLLEDNRSSPSQAAAASGPSKGGRPKKNAQAAEKPRPYEAKKLKKKIAQQWRDVSTAIAAGRSPEPSLAKDLLDLCQEYGHGAERQWHDMWQESVATIERLLALAAEGDFQGASELVKAVTMQKKACHKRFK